LGNRGARRPHRGGVKAVVEAFVREWLTDLLSNKPDMILVGEVDDPRIALQVVAERRPNLIVTGLSLNDSVYAKRAIRAAGSGFITKPEPGPNVRLV
jgi:DNA-binding NarL/FixJ family response regulator